MKSGIKILNIICLLVFVISCQRKQTNPEFILSGTELGKVDHRLKEASGLVASINNPGFLWSINDSGNPAEVFLIDNEAHVRLVCTLHKAQNRDWEDIAIDTAPDGKNYLYIADIGDNSSKYESKIIYRFEEPVLALEETAIITQFETLVLRMPDSERDAETILIEPITHDLFIISKREDSVGLYRAPHILSSDTMVFEKIQTLPFTRIVAGSISTDGNQILLKDYNKIYYWKKTPNETLQHVLTTPPVELPYLREQQGEALAWSRTNEEFYTLSESTWGKPASLIVHNMILDKKVR